MSMTSPRHRYVAPSVKDKHGHAVLRLSMGVLLHTLVTNMEEAVAATSSSGSSNKAVSSSSSSSAQAPRMYLYSGHDSTIMPILSALGVDLSTWPPYTSNLVFELWELPATEAGGKAGKKPPQHVVRVLYNREELGIPHAAPGGAPCCCIVYYHVFVLSCPTSFFGGTEVLCLASCNTWGYRYHQTTGII